MKHPSYTFAWVAEMMHFKSPSDLKQNKPTTLAEERTGSRHMAIKKKFGKTKFVWNSNEYEAHQTCYILLLPSPALQQQA